MKEFPSKLNINNKDNFSKYNYQRNISYLRRDIYEFILKRNEEDYFDLDKFNKERVNDVKLVNEMTEKIIEELSELGWKCKFAFGHTGLYIYSTEKHISDNFISIES